jgi:signal transduction histidine kinase
METNIYNTMVLIGCLLAAILIFFIISIIRYHRKYVKLQKERIHAEITIQENERKRIATDLHDSLGPLLSSIKLQINSLDSTSSNDQQIINKAGRHLDEIITNLREISHNLLPNTLQRKGLTEAIREFSGNNSKRNGTKIDFYQLQPVTIPPEKEIHVFRMMQEIIHNALKHAHAKNLQIGMGKENNEIIILSKDDGVGFDPERVRKTSSGLGLKSIESRIEILNGTYILKSSPGHGTSYFIKIPVKT